MLKELTSEQITEWLAYNKIDPIGKWRDDYRLSYLAAVVSNNFIKAFGKKNSKMQPVSDFKFPWQENKQKLPTQEQLTAALMSWAVNHNKAIEAQEKRERRNAPSKK